MTDEEFLAAFERQAISRDNWTHEAHVRMTWLYARNELDMQSALEKVRTGIRALNGVNHVNSTLYHETVTIAFGSIIHCRANQQGAPDTWPAFRDANRDLIDPGPSPLLAHYTRETLETEDARTTYVPPDLKPLPT